MPPPPIAVRVTRPQRFLSAARVVCGCAFVLAFSSGLKGVDYHLDPMAGADGNSGTSAEDAWRSLSRAQDAAFVPGDRLLLKRGSRFNGGLKLNLEGTAEHPIVIEAYGEGSLPLVDAQGRLAGIHLVESHHVIVRDLEITADGGRPRDGSPPDVRYGVLVDGSPGGSSHVALENLVIHRIYPEVGRPHEGHNPTTHLGTAISIEGARRGAVCTDFRVEGCRIEQTGFKAINLKSIRRVDVLNNRMKDIGGPAIQPGVVQDLVVRGNVVDGSGSSLDPRMHARGSGIWPWTCQRVLIEKNTFMHARGKADSCGIHIDFNCRDVVVQYNLSVDNEGGFIEILGNNHNCAYRYNISVNDGARVKGRNGAHQEGKVLWTSGYVGQGQKKRGPFNSYIYNNTIYAGPGSRSCFSVSPTTEGLLIANNIFHLLGDTENVVGDQDKRHARHVARIARARMQNNLYSRESILPEGLPLVDQNPILGDPRFQKAGGLTALDYRPGNARLVQDKGIIIPALDGDPAGLRMGLEVREDFLGNPIVGLPDLGAIELSR
jgi:hypothetical protein